MNKFNKMDRIITDNSKVNENLLNEVNTVNQQNKELIVKNMDLQEQLLIQRVSQRSELLLDFMEHLSNYHNIDEVIDCTKYQHIIEQYEKSNNCG